MQREGIEITKHSDHPFVSVHPDRFANGFLVGPAQVIDHALVDHDRLRGVRGEIARKGSSLHHLDIECFDEIVTHQEGRIPEGLIIEHPFNNYRTGVVVGSENVFHSGYRHHLVMFFKLFG